MARYIDEINEFEIRTTTLAWVCSTKCKLPINSNTTKLSCTTTSSDGVEPLLHFASFIILKVSEQHTRFPGSRCTFDFPCCRAAIRSCMEAPQASKFVVWNPNCVYSSADLSPVGTGVLLSRFLRANILVSIGLFLCVFLSTTKIYAAIDFIESALTDMWTNDTNGTS